MTTGVTKDGNKQVLNTQKKSENISSYFQDQSKCITLYTFVNGAQNKMKQNTIQNQVFILVPTSGNTVSLP